MKNLVSIATILFQLSTTFVVLLIIYLIFALLDISEADMVNMLGFFIFQPILGFILISLTIVICLVLGLPIRLIPKIYYWWSSKPFIILAGNMIGLFLLLLSFKFPEEAKVVIDGVEQIKVVPNTAIALSGWFLIAFILLHFYPMTIVRWIKDKFS